MADHDAGLNWFYAAKGLECLKLGLENYVQTQLEQLYNNLLQTVINSFGYSAIDSSLQTIIELPIKSYFKPQPYHCDIHNTRDENECTKEKCPNAVCSKLLNEIKELHTYKKPIWSNTNPSKWTCGRHVGDSEMLAIE